MEPIHSATLDMAGATAPNVQGSIPATPATKTARASNVRISQTARAPHSNGPLSVVDGGAEAESSAVMLASR